jgi:hypothetical protein
MDQQELVAHTLVSIHRTATKIATLPVGARAAALDEAHHAYASAMHEVGQDNVAAGRWVETVMTAVRAVIEEIDHGGEARIG